MSGLEALLQGLFVMAHWRVLLSTLVFSILLYKLPFWRRTVSPYFESFSVPQPSSTSPEPPPSVPLPPPLPGRFRRIATGITFKIWNFFINFPLYGLLLSVYLFFVTPVVISPLEGETFELSANYLQTAWPAATIAMMAGYLLVLLPKVGKFFDDLHILSFFGAIPIMVELYSRETLLNLLTSSPFVFIVHPVFTGALLILLKVATSLRETIARGIRRLLFLFLRYDGIRAEIVESSLACALAPFFFAGPIFALFIFIYNIHFVPGAR
jgi:hypothetical protein